LFPLLNREGGAEEHPPHNLPFTGGGAKNNPHLTGEGLGTVFVPSPYLQGEG